MDFRSK